MSLQHYFTGISAIYFKRGETIFTHGHPIEVVHLQKQGETRFLIESIVQGSADEPYEQQILLHKQGTQYEVHGFCDCPVGHNCKHVAAVLVKLSVQLLIPESKANTLPPAVKSWLNQWQTASDQSRQTALAKPAATFQLVYVLENVHSVAHIQLYKNRINKTGPSASFEAVNRPLRDLLTEQPSYIQPDDLPLLRQLALMSFEYHSMRAGMHPLQGPQAIPLLRAISDQGRIGLKPSRSFRNLKTCKLHFESDPRELHVTWQENRTEWTPRFSIAGLPEEHDLQILLLPDPICIDADTETLFTLGTPLDTTQLRLLKNMPALPQATVAEFLKQSQNILPAEVTRSLQKTGLIEQLPGTAEFRLRVTRYAHTQSFNNDPCYWPKLPHLNGCRVLIVEVRYTHDKHHSEWVPATLSNNPQWAKSISGKDSGKRSGKTVRLLKQPPDIERQVVHAYMDELPIQSIFNKAENFDPDNRPLVNQTYHEAPADFHDFGVFPVLIPHPDNHWQAIIESARAQAEARHHELLIDPEADITVHSHNDIQIELVESDSGWFELTYQIEINGHQVELANILSQLVKINPHIAEDIASGATEHITIALDDEQTTFARINASHLLPALQTLAQFYKPGGNGSVRIARYDIGLLQHQATHYTLKGDADLVRTVGHFDQIIHDFKLQLDPRLNAELRPYQREGVAWLLLLNELGFNGLLADDMGLGKTLQTLATISAWRIKNKTAGCSLVVAPNSLLHNWKAEAERFLPHYNTQTLEAGQPFPAHDKLLQTDILVMPYSLLNRHRQPLQQSAWQWLVVDESQRIKNAHTQTAQCLKSIPADKKIALSGTPVENHLGELWSQMDFLMPGFLGNRLSFDKQWRKPIEKKSDQSVAQQLAHKLKPFIKRRTKSEVAKDLPPKTEQILKVPLGNAQKQAYETIRSMMNTRLQESLRNAGFAKSQILFLEALLRLRQVCCHPSLIQSSADSAKFEMLQDLLQTLVDEGRTVLVFSQFTEMLQLISAELIKTGIHHIQLTGESKNRQAIVDEFNTGKVPVFLVSLKAGGVGLNLTKADTVIIYDPWWNPAAEQQAIDRAHRIGQTQPVSVIRLIAENTVEEKILQLQTRKSDLASQILKAAELHTGLSEKDFLDFLS